MNPSQFSMQEIQELRDHGIVLFAGRVIFEAQPPMPPEQVGALQALCGHAIPEPLLALWRQTAGGRLDYDLRLTMAGREEAISWAELFYVDSDGYRDLTGWIEHERELAKEAAQERGEVWSGRLAVLPFGGFEYCDRIYIVTDPAADDHGHVLAWKQGLPPAWRGAMHEDGMATVATDLHAAFQALTLEEDPLAPARSYGAGSEFLDYLERRQEDDALPAVLAEKLIAYYRTAMLDWRTPLSEGTIARDPQLVRCALHHAIETDDESVVARLAAAGADLYAVSSGSAIPTVHAFGAGAYAVTAALLRAGAPIERDILASTSGPAPAELVALLLAAGAQPDAGAMAVCVANGKPDSARHIGSALAGSGMDVSSAYGLAASRLLEDLLAAERQVVKGKLSHYLGRDGLALHIQRLREFQLVTG